MLINKDELDLDDMKIVLCEGLMDQNGEWYDLTFDMSLREECHGEVLLACKYAIVEIGQHKTLYNFVGWTKSRVIYNVVGIGVVDTLLSSVARNPY